MSSSYESVGNHNYARNMHANLTEIMEGMGMFVDDKRYSDEIDLRNQVAEFFSSQFGLDISRARTVAESVVPMVDNYAYECIEGDLAAKVVPRISAKAMLLYGINGNFNLFDNTYFAYRAGTATFNATDKSTAAFALEHTAIQDTRHHSDTISVTQDNDPIRVNYRNTLRRLVTRRIITDDVYTDRMQNANLRPVSPLMRKLKRF